jgi:hypothetical protein
MSWNGTVYCGYCGTRGHNRRGCPKRKAAEAKELANNPDSHWSRDIKQRQQRAATVNTQRRCSYCNGKGHNRRGCTTLKGDRVEVQKAYTGYRRKFAEYAKEKGFGVGALIKMPVSSTKECDSYFIGMITEMHWDAVTHVYSSTRLRNGHLSGQEQWLATMRVFKIVDGKYVGHHHGWKPVQVGQSARVSANRICHSLPDMFPEYVRWLATPDVEARWSSEIISPVQSVSIPKDYYDREISADVEHTYRFAPAKKAEEWEKRRQNQGSLLWGDIYHCGWEPEEDNNEAP